jgi:hypothetical protein
MQNVIKIHSRGSIIADNQISLQVYPNPSTSFVSIEGDEVVKGNKILVYEK